MTIHYIKLDILKVTEGIILHGCNSKGVMGKGLALGIKNKYINCYNKYRQYCLENLNNDVLGNVILYKEPGLNLYIGNCITQADYGNNPNKVYVSYEAIEKCFNFANILALNNNLPIFTPKIGAGLGKGDWNKISEIIEMAISPNVNCYVCFL